MWIRRVDGVNGYGEEYMIQKAKTSKKLMTDT